MPRNYSAVIADARCFILLDKIESLPLLQSLFKTISTSIEVAEEFGKPLPGWVQIKAVQDKNFQSARFYKWTQAKPAL
jgi:predicted nucleic acid-binding protein